MITNDITVVFFDREDVNNYNLSGKTVCDFIALTPSASEAARTQGLAAQNSRTLFSDIEQCRCVIAGHRVLKEADRSPLLSELPPAIRLMTRQSLWLMAFLKYRLVRTLRQGPWLVRTISGAWQVAEDHRALLQIMLPRIWEYGLAHTVHAGRPPLSWIYGWLLRLAARVAARQRKSWVGSSTRKLRSGWPRAIKRAGAHLVLMQPTTGHWHDYRKLLPPHGDAMVLKVPPFPDNDPRVASVVETLRQIGMSLHDRDLAFSWSLYIEYMKKIVPAMLGLSEEGSRLLNLMKVRAVFGFEANSWLSAALYEAAGRVGVRRVALNHNSQPPSGNPVADSVLSTLFTHRTSNPLVDIAGLWSPFALDWKTNFNPHGTQSLRQPVNFEHQPPKPPGNEDRPFRILHAGNYQNWSEYFPWISETSDEFLHGMERLAAAVENVEGVELIFRVRPKKEVDAQTLRSRLKIHPNVVICGTEEDFLRQLADCDLLVAHFSTTVEQALQMGKPVLLWGNTRRYRQFPGRGTPPDRDSRAAVYAVSREQDLPRMLAAIRDAHHGRPLTPEESRPYRFPEAPSLTDWTRSILDPVEHSQEVTIDTPRTDCCCNG